MTTRVAVRGLLAIATSTVLAAQALPEVVARAERQGFRTGVMVLDLRSGEPTYEHRAGEAFVPASNQKLLTVAAALWGLGADYRFRTQFRMHEGFLEVLAAGDPNWQTGGPHDPAVIFGKVAERLKEAHVETIRGVRLVRGRFTGPARPEGWPEDQFDRDYCAPTAGLVLEQATFRARISPTGGSRARVEMLEPPVEAVFAGGIRMTNRKQRRLSYWLSHQGESFRAHGEFPSGGESVAVRGVCQDPEWLFAETLETALRRGGIGIDPQAEAAEGFPVMVWESRMRECLGPILAESSNFHAEQVLRVLGAELCGSGTFAGGCAAVRRVVAARLAIPPAVEIQDGSGLSRGNRVTPRFLVRLLAELLQDGNGKLLAENLPQGGVDGTLRNRFRGREAIGRRVRGKTGTIDGVKALSGLVQLDDGRLRVFSILMNRADGGTSNRGAAALQDAMVAAIHGG